MKINSFYLAQMHNGEHTAFHSESIEHTDRANPGLLGVGEQVTSYKNALNEQKLAIDVFAASKQSAESLRLDQSRDKAYSALKAYLKVCVNDLDDTLSDAAERVLFVVRKSAIDVGNPLDIGLAKATTAVNSLLRNLEPLRADIELVGATGRLNALEAANRAFEELQIELNIEKAGKRSGNVKETRAVTDAAYRDLVERINAMALLHGNEILDAYIKEQNAIIDKYANIIARRKGIAKKGENIA
jgi:hypothetical protein